MRFGYDGTGLGDISVATSKVAVVAISTTAAAHTQIGVDMFGLPLPVLFTALVGALLSLLFMDPLQGKQRRFLPLTVLAFALIGAALTIVLPKVSLLRAMLGDAPAPMLGLIFGFLGHRLIPLITVDGPAAIKSALARWRAPNA